MGHIRGPMVITYSIIVLLTLDVQRYLRIFYFFYVLDCPMPVADQPFVSDFFVHIHKHNDIALSL